MTIEEIKDKIIKKAKKIDSYYGKDILVFPRNKSDNEVLLDKVYQSILEADKTCCCHFEGVVYPTFAREKDSIEIIEIAPQYKTYSALYGIDLLPEEAKIGTIKLSDLCGRFGLRVRWSANGNENENQITLYDFLINNFLDDFYIEIYSTSYIHFQFIRQWLSLQDYGQNIINSDIWSNYVLRYVNPDRDVFLDSFLGSLGGPKYYAHAEESTYDYVLAKIAELHLQYPECNRVNLSKFHRCLNKKMERQYKEWKKTLEKIIPGAHVSDNEFKGGALRIIENEFSINDSFIYIRLCYHKGKEKQNLHWYYDVFSNEWHTSLTDFDFVTSVLESGMFDI